MHNGLIEEPPIEPAATTGWMRGHVHVGTSYPLISVRVFGLPLAPEAGEDAMAYAVALARALTARGTPPQRLDVEASMAEIRIAGEVPETDPALLQSIAEHVLCERAASGRWPLAAAAAIRVCSPPQSPTEPLPAVAEAAPPAPPPALAATEQRRLARLVSTCWRTLPDWRARRWRPHPAPLLPRVSIARPRLRWRPPRRSLRAPQLSLRAPRLSIQAPRLSIRLPALRWAPPRWRTHLPRRRLLLPRPSLRVPRIALRLLPPHLRWPSKPQVHLPRPPRLELQLRHRLIWPGRTVPVASVLLVGLGGLVAIALSPASPGFHGAVPALSRPARPAESQPPAEQPATPRPPAATTNAVEVAAAQAAVPTAASAPTAAAETLPAAAGDQPDRTPLPPLPAAQPGGPTDAETPDTPPASASEPAPLRTLLDTMPVGPGAAATLGWPDDPASTAWFAADGYHLFARTATQFVAVGVLGQQQLDETLVSATFHKIGGPAGGGYGIIARDQGPGPRDGRSQTGAYYVFEVGDRGEVGIWRRAQDTWVDVLPWTTSAAVHPGIAENVLTVHLVGGQLSLAVNGLEVANTRDDTLAMGGVGLFVGGDQNQASLTHLVVQTSDS